MYFYGRGLYLDKLNSLKTTVITFLAEMQQ